MSEEWIICCVCGEKFALEGDTAAVLRRSGNVFYCPWGHSIVLNRQHDGRDTKGQLKAIEGGKP